MDMQETRRAERRSADQPSTLRGEGSAPQDSWVHDVSSTGMRIECRADLAIGEWVTVGLAGAGSTRARIVWRRGQEYGCAFEEPLSETDAAHACAGSPIVQLHAFGAKATATPPAEEVYADVRRLIDDQPANGKLWMAGLAALMLAVAAPASLMLSHLIG